MMPDQHVHHLLPTRPRSLSMTTNDGRSGTGAGSATGPERQYPLIGVVTPVRNRRHWTIGFARMLCQQDYPLFKSYIVDSQSTDGTPEALRGLNLPPIVVLSAPDRAYWTEATNIGVQRALDDGCDYILTINDDAIISDDYLTTLVGAAKKGNAQICGSVISYADTPGKLWGVGAYNDWNSGAFLQLKLANIWDDAIDNRYLQEDKLINVDYLCGNGTLIHRSIFEIIGLYDAKNTPHYHADSEFTMRLEQAGISRWVAARARLFNRFSEVGDGAFAARNQKLFSLRSANYAPAVLYVLDRYCPPRMKATALVRYSMRHLHQNHWRQWSRLLRMVSFLAQAADKRVVTYEHFFPPTDETRCLAQDLEILLSLPDLELSVMMYAYLLRRAGSDLENSERLGILAQGASRETIVGEFIGSQEFADRPGARVDYTAALLRLRTQPDAEIHSGKASPYEQWVLTCIARNGRVPSHAEARRWSQSTDDGHSSAVPRPHVVSSMPERSGAHPVFMNVDVLCMAVLDPKAATGVHRYVLNILKGLAADPTVDLHVFHAPELSEAAAQLRKPDGHLANISFALADIRPVRGTVFYPYFPMTQKDPRFSGLPEAVMIHDLFPLTNPEWFSAIAVSNFRRQLHGLVDTTHLFCNSAATETQIRGVFPGRRWTTSVAHPGVKGPGGAGRFNTGPWAAAASMIQQTIGRGVGKDPYFLCVGTIEPRKNLATVIRALGLLEEPDVRGIQMLVVGQEGWNVSSHDLGTLAGSVRDRIQFLGRVSERRLWSLYRDAVCTVFPSLAEGFGFPVVESMVCGTPVVTSDLSSMREIAQRGAIRVDPLDASAIAEAIERIATDHALRRRLSQDAVEQAGLYTWKTCTELHVREFARLDRLSLDRVEATPLLTALA